MAKQPGNSRDAGRRRRGLFGPLVLSYLAGIALIVALVHYGGVWNVLANTRVLDLLIGGGVVALTDADAGFIQGVPDLTYYAASQDPVDWELVLLVGAMFVAMWFIKAYQFHALARFAGIDGSFGEHARAHLYGRGIGRVVPFGAGTVATVSALEAKGVPRERAAQALYASELFTLFEIVLFAAIGLYLTGITTWVGELFWPLVILATAWFLVRPGRGQPGGVREARLRAGLAVRALMREPRMLLWLAALSIVAFLLADEGAYLIAQAFTSDNVILNVDGRTVLMAIVGAQLARYVRFTPGGIGQWEWGFAAVLYVGGLGFPEAATIALLVSATRYAAGGIVFGLLMLTKGVDTNMRKVFDTFLPRPASQETT